MQKIIAAVLFYCANEGKEMLENYSTVSDSPRISSDLFHSQSQEVHCRIHVKAKLENFICYP